MRERSTKNACKLHVIYLKTAKEYGKYKATNFIYLELNFYVEFQQKMITVVQYRQSNNKFSKNASGILLQFCQVMMYHKFLNPFNYL